jgi:hypothetical protein
MKKDIPIYYDKVIKTEPKMLCSGCWKENCKGHNLFTINLKTSCLRAYLWQWHCAWD